jgi:hypothetical protein
MMLGNYDWMTRMQHIMEIGRKSKVVPVHVTKTYGLVGVYRIYSFVTMVY